MRIVVVDDDPSVAMTLEGCLQALGYEVAVANHGGEAMEWFHTYLQPRDSRSSLYSPGMGHLGTGLPFANAAKLANPDRPVFCAASPSPKRRRIRAPSSAQ